MVVEKLPIVWLVDIVTSLSHAVEGEGVTPRSLSPQTIFTVGFSPPVLKRVPDRTAVFRLVWVELITPRLGGTRVDWANEIKAPRASKAARSASFVSLFIGLVRI